MIQRPPRSTLIPCTTRFRSVAGEAVDGAVQHLVALMDVDRRQRALGDDALLDVLHPRGALQLVEDGLPVGDRKSTLLNFSHANISYAVFCLYENSTIAEDS